MHEFESPYKKNQTVLMMTARNTEEVAMLARSVLEPGVQATSTGDLVVVDRIPDKDRYQTASLSVGEPYYVGTESVMAKIRLYLYNNEYAFYIIGITLAVFIAISMLILYRNYVYRKSAMHGKSPKGFIMDKLKQIFSKLFIRKDKDD